LSKRPRERWEIIDDLKELAIHEVPYGYAHTDKYPKCYLSGPMTGLPDFNVHAFEACTQLLRDSGWEVLSPHENDAEAGVILEGTSGKIEELENFSFKHAMAKDLFQVCSSDAMFVMPGWEESTGGKIEVDVAQRVGVPVYSILSCREIEAGVMVGDSPILDCGPKSKYVDPETGGAKEESLSRYDLVPPDGLTELAKVYGYGEQKYPSGPDGPNYLRGYPWHLSIASLERHVQKFKAGEDIDPETGLHHLAHAAWHAMTLVAFGRRGLGRDDRVKLKAA
jgi:hypothetical protein